MGVIACYYWILRVKFSAWPAGGIVTINGNPDPLIVLDGMVYNGDIGNIDVEQIDHVVYCGTRRPHLFVV